MGCPSGQPIFHAFPSIEILSGGAAINGLELLVEVAGVEAAHLLGDLCQALAALFNKIGRPLHLDLRDDSLSGRL